MAADGSRLLVLTPAGAREVPANDELHRNRVGRPAQHGAACEVLDPHVRHLRSPYRQVVVRADPRSGHEPMLRQTRQDLALVRDRLGQHDVVCTYPIGGHQEEALVVDPEELTYLPGTDVGGVHPYRASKRSKITSVFAR